MKPYVSCFMKPNVCIYSLYHSQKHKRTIAISPAATANIKIINTSPIKLSRASELIKYKKDIAKGSFKIFDNFTSVQSAR